MTDVQTGLLSATVGVIAKSAGLIKGVVIAEVVITNHAWLSTLATGALAGTGGIIVNEIWKAIKAARQKRNKSKTKPEIK